MITRDRPAYLAVLLSSLMGQTKKDWDLILVDNSTTPVSKDFLCSTLLARIQWEGHRIKYMNVDCNIRDIGQLRNICIDNDNWNKTATRIDDDSYCEPHYLERLYACIISSIGVGAVGGLVPMMMNEKVYRPTTQKVCEITEFFDLKDESDQCFFYNQKEAMEADHLRSTFMYWNDIAKKVRHPECYGKTGYREETDFSYRIKLAGYKLLVVPDAVCWHLVSPYGGGRDESKDIRIENITLFKQRMKEAQYGSKQHGT